MNRIIREDMEYVTKAEFIPWEKVDGKTVFITGATGLIGYYLTASLLLRKAGIHVIVLTRNIESAKKRFADFQGVFDEELIFLEGTMEEFPHIIDDVEYIVHGASPTASEEFALHPVETIESIVEGCRNILKLAKEKKVKGMIYLSSMEVYGVVHSHELVDENHPICLDITNPRNSYPISKMLCENLCAGYSREYKVDVKIARLTQTFGPGIRKDDRRVFAYFLERCRNGEDIVLLTEGKTHRSYLYLADAATAIFVMMLKGDSGNAYNAANKNTYCSIRELAELAIETVSEKKNRVRVDVKKTQAMKFMEEHYMNLDTRKLQNLGWNPKFDLAEMLVRTVAGQES